MVLGGINPALIAWRQGILNRFPDRDDASDGGIGDEFHEPPSEHIANVDGTVDAFDCDVNFLGSDAESGNPMERRICDALKADFEQDPRAKLWIHRSKIANADVDDWRVRDYDRAHINPHNKHIHFQTRQSKEDDDRSWSMQHTDALLAETEDDMTPAQFLALLNDDNVAARVRQLAGQGVHNQKLGGSDETIGQDLQSDEDKDILARLDRLEQTLNRIDQAVTKS
jgi:hypothetical protein